MANKKRLADHVAEKLEKMITKEQVYLPGEKLPNEIELAESLGVSRTTLRDAEKVLILNNILIKKRGLGTFVVSKETLEEDNEFLPDQAVMGNRLFELYDLRMMMEPQIAGLAASKGTEEDVEKIIACAKKIESNELNSHQVMQYNRAFHNAIAEATHNKFVIRLFHSINDAIVSGFECYDEEKVNNEDMLRSHKMIYEYIRMKDTDGAIHAMEIHLRYAKKDFLGENGIEQ